MFRFFRKREKKLGLSLSGGGARGLAHIGVLKVLEREGIPIHCLSGSSMGGVVAAGYASGLSAQELEAEAIRMGALRELAKLVDLRPPRRGLLTGKALGQYLANVIPEGITFNQLKIPLAVKAVDLCQGVEVDLHDGLVMDAVLATIAFPGLFPPQVRDDMRLVDGGVLNNLPVDLLKPLGANISVAVHVAPCFDKDACEPPPSIARLPEFAFDIYLTMLLMTRALTLDRLRHHPPDLLIEPDLPISVGVLSGFTHPNEVIAIGEQAAQAALEKIKDLLQ